MRLMSTLIQVAAVAALAATPAVAREPSHRPHKAEPLIGTWQLDLDSMGIPAAMRPLSVTVTFSAPDTETWRTAVHIIAPDNSVRHMESLAPRTGRSVPIIGDQMEADSIAVTIPSTRVLIMGLAKDGRPGSTRVYTVSADGRTMTEAASNVGDDGKPFIRTFQYRRARSGKP